MLRLTVLACALWLGACGSGEERRPAPPALSITWFAVVGTEHFVGEPVQLVATFSGGNARIDPGGIAVVSGVPVTTPVLAGTQPFRLTVTNGRDSISEEIEVAVRYRERMRTLDLPAARE